MASQDAVFMHFPDPWWKKRHEKRLVMGDVFLTQVTRLLAPGGELFIQTDVEERADQYEALLRDLRGVTPDGDAPGSLRLAENPAATEPKKPSRASGHRRWPPRSIACACVGARLSG